MFAAFDFQLTCFFMPRLLNIFKRNIFKRENIFRIVFTVEFLPTIASNSHLKNCFCDLVVNAGAGEQRNVHELKKRGEEFESLWDTVPAKL